MAIEKITDNVWVVTRPFLIPLGGDIGGRMTILRLQNCELILVSPVELHDMDVTEIKKLGVVKYVIAPNSMHHLYLKKAQAHFPGSQVAGPPGLREKRSDIQFDLILSPEVWPQANDVELFVVKAKSPMNEEVLFFHKKDKVLVVTDLVFNIQNISGFVRTIMAKLNNAYKRLGMTRVGRQVFNNKISLKEALAQISKWQPEILILAHGENVRGDIANKLKESFSWLGR